MSRPACSHLRSSGAAAASGAAPPWREPAEACRRVTRCFCAGANHLLHVSAGIAHPQAGCAPRWHVSRRGVERASHRRGAATTETAMPAITAGTGGLRLRWAPPDLAPLGASCPAWQRRCPAVLLSMAAAGAGLPGQSCCVHHGSLGIDTPQVGEEWSSVLCLLGRAVSAAKSIPPPGCEAGEAG